MGSDCNREAEILRQARQRMGYTQQEIATILGVHVKAYQRLEYGERSMRNCSMHLGLAICAILGLDPFRLVFGGEFKAVAVFQPKK